MGTLHADPATLSPQPARPPITGARGWAKPDATVRQFQFDGLTWTCRAGSEVLLAALPARAWADPERQPGWTLVKQNVRRQVYRGVIRGSPYYLKYYRRDNWLRVVRRLFKPDPCRAEWESGLFAVQAGIPSTLPLACTTALRRQDGYYSLLISEALEPAQPLSEFWLTLQTDQDTVRRRRDVAALGEQLAEMIARAHQAGFEHLDMHADNILVHTLAPRRYRTVFVDLQSARRGVPLSDQAVVRNLAQLNQWFRRHSSVPERVRFLRAYLRWRNEYETAYPHGRPLGLTFRELVAALVAAAERHAWRLWAQRDRRLVRDGRYFTRLRLPGGWHGMAVSACKHASEESAASRLVFARHWWQQALRELLTEKLADSAACKQSHSAWVGRAVLEQRVGRQVQRIPVIIKRPRARNWWRRLVQLLPSSRSRRGWRMGHSLLHRDIATARPLAFLERRLCGLVRDSLLVTEAIPGGADLETFLRQRLALTSGLCSREWFVLKQRLNERLARALRQLHERGFIHRDCKAANILVAPHPPLKLLWIDMDGLRRRRWGRSSRKDGRLSSAEVRALARLHVSLGDVPGLTRGDRVRFLRTYLAGYGVPPDSWRRAWSELAQAARRKAQAKERRRLWKLEHYGRA